MKEITVGISRTINLGNFESLRVDVSATATVFPEENEADVRAQISAWLKD